MLCYRVSTSKTRKQRTSIWWEKMKILGKSCRELNQEARFEILLLYLTEFETERNIQRKILLADTNIEYSTKIIFNVNFHSCWVWRMLFYTIVDFNACQVQHMSTLTHVDFNACQVQHMSTLTRVHFNTCHLWHVWNWACVVFSVGTVRVANYSFQSPLQLLGKATSSPPDITTRYSLAMADSCYSLMRTSSWSTEMAYAQLRPTPQTSKLTTDFFALATTRSLKRQSAKELEMEGRTSRTTLRSNELVVNPVP